MLSLLALEPALSLVAEAGIDAIREKSIRLTEYAMALSDVLLTPLGFTLGSPREPERAAPTSACGTPRAIASIAP